MTRTLADNRYMPDRKSATWAIVCASLTATTVFGLALVVYGQWFGSPQAVRIGLILTLPAAALAIVTAIAALAMLIFRTWAFLLEREADSEPGEEDEYIAADEIVPPQAAADTTGAVPLLPAPPALRKIIHAVRSNFGSARWGQHLPELLAVPPEHRVVAELLSRACMRLGLPRDREAWRHNSEWFHEYVPDLIMDKHLRYVVFEVTMMDEIARRRAVAFFAMLSTYQSEPHPSSVRILNAPRDFVSELKRFNVKVAEVDSGWVEAQRKGNESLVLCSPAM